MGKIQDQARADHQDLVGVSFGATRDLLRFWEACGLAPVHLGTSRNAASGAQAAVVLGALSATGEALARRARERFSRRLPAQLAGPCRSLEPDLAATLLAMTAPEPPPAGDEPDWRELAAFAFAQRPFEASYTSLRALTGGLCGASSCVKVISASARPSPSSPSYSNTGTGGRSPGSRAPPGGRR